MRVTWRTEPLGRKRMPQNHGRVLDAAKAKETDEGVTLGEALGYLCRHRGEGRMKLRPVIQVRQEATAERGRWTRSYRLPTFRSCCLDSLPAREAYWDAVDPLLEQWFAARSLPKGDHFGIRDLWLVKRSLAKRIPRPASRARRASWLKAQHACVARKREASHREGIFSTLGLDIHATIPEIRQALQRRKLEILRNNGSLDQLRQVQSAAEQATAYRSSGM